MLALLRWQLNKSKLVYMTSLQKFSAMRSFCMIEILIVWSLYLFLDRQNMSMRFEIIINIKWN